MPSGLAAGAIPDGPEPEAAEPFAPGEAAARERLSRWLAGGIERYADRHDRLAGGTSRALALPALRLRVGARDRGARARRRAARAPPRSCASSPGATSTRTSCCTTPATRAARTGAQFDALEWEDDDDALDAWREGRTGYPVVDAGMRQLAHQGWMHNRARLIVASFLTKDLHLDWRAGEAHFMRHLLCGDEAQNNGNWQWITSIGVDPAPYFRRLYNPVAQQRRHDPDGDVRAPLVPRAARRPARASSPSRGR